MQIQRIQTLWLLIAVIFGVVSLFFPWLKIDGGMVGAFSDVPLMVLALLACVLPFIAVFLFRNLRRQKLLAAISALMAVFTVAYAVALSFLGPNPESELCIWAPLAMCVSGLFDILARRGMVRDEKLLRSADRLR